MDFFITAEFRNSTGRNNNVKVRKDGKVPAVVYFQGSSTPICFDFSYINGIVKNLSNGNRLLNIHINNDKHLVVIKDFYKHPVTSEILHVDFQRVLSTDIITLDVFLNFIGEKNSVGIKHGGFLVKHKYLVKVRCVLLNLPNFIDVDVSNVNINESLYLTDLVMPNGVKLVLSDNNVNSKVLVASIVGSRALEQKAQDAKAK